MLWPLCDISKSNWPECNSFYYKIGPLCQDLFYILRTSPRWSPCSLSVFLDPATKLGSAPWFSFLIEKQQALCFTYRKRFPREKDALHGTTVKRDFCRFPAALVAFFMAGVFSCHAGIMDHWTTELVSSNHIGLDFVAFGQGRYVAYGEYSDWGAIMSSEDGINWTLRDDGGGFSGSGLSYSIGLSYAGGKFFA